ncbi:MAG: hypothetical protein ABJM26_05625 [Anderseniella sp.]
MTKKIMTIALSLAVLAALAPATPSALAGPGFKQGGGGGGGGGGPGGGPGGFAPGGGGGGGGGNGGGWGGWGGGGFGIVINPGPRRYYDDDRISCRTGKRIVRKSGYRRVRVIECRGNTYTYKGKRGSRVYRLSVDSLDGIIVGRRRL